MAIHLHATLEDTVYFWFAANDTSGSGGDGASPLADVRLAGAAASAAPVLSPTPALLTHASFPAGAHEVAVAATAANGFSATATYGVFCSLSVDGQNPTGFVGSFTLDPVKANVVEVSDDATAAVNLETACDNYSATRGLAGTALPAAVAGAAGGIPLSTAGSLEMDTLADWVNAGRLDAILDELTTQGDTNETKLDTVIDDTDLIDDATSGLAKIATDVAAILSDTGTDGVVLANGSISAAKIAASAFVAAAFAADVGEEFADALLGRSIQGGANGTRTLTDCLRLLRNKVSIAGGTMTVTQENDSTTAWTATVTTASGDPIDSIDPA